MGVNHGHKKHGNQDKTQGKGQIVVIIDRGYQNGHKHGRENHAQSGGKDKAVSGGNGIGQRTERGGFKQVSQFF
jgi:hypothetical protein